MKIILVYINVRTKIDTNYVEPYRYVKGVERFKETYLKFKSTIPHDLIVVNAGEASKSSFNFDEVGAQYQEYHGPGWDCGTYQAVARRTDCDLMIGFNTLAYFWKSGWLEPFVRAFNKHGPGVYGPTSSRQFNAHLRTPCIGFAPDVIRSYPLLVDSRSTCCLFEHGTDNFSLWAQRQGFPSMLVTADGEYSIDDWRKPSDIFRRGNQSNCLVYDRHTLLYAESSPAEKRLLELDADGVIAKPQSP